MANPEPSSLSWMDAYSRVLLGHDLEPYLQGKARANQSAGGKKKGSSSLTEAETLDVWSEISSEIGVSAGSITKVKHLRKEAHPRVEQAVRDGVISIHKAWCLSHPPRLRQVKELEDHQTQKGLNKTSCLLIRKHVATLTKARVEVAPRRAQNPQTSGKPCKWTCSLKKARQLFFRIHRFSESSLSLNLPQR